MQDKDHLADGVTSAVRGEADRTALAVNEYRCAMCNGVFVKGWTDEEAMQEAARTHGVAIEECDVFCDDCYKKTLLTRWPEQVNGIQHARGKVK